MPKKLTQEQFLEKLREVHGDTITTDDRYVRSSAKITFHCNARLGHEDWEATPNKILGGQGCPKCRYIKSSARQVKSHSEFIKEINKVAGDSIIIEGKYVNDRTKIKFKCKYCDNTWETTPNHILRGQGCPRCREITRASSKILSQSEFLAKLRIAHGDTVSPLGKYKNAKTPIDVLCNLCSYKWKVSPAHLLGGSGCPNCASSSGEQTVRAILEFNNINYDPQHNFKIKGNIHRLDTILKDKNNNWCVIQPDGQQHFKSNSYMGGEKEFEHRKQMDRDENKYLPALGVRVLRIPWFWFDLDNIFILLQDFLGYKLNKPDKDYAPKYKRIKDMVYDYLRHGNRCAIAKKYGVNEQYPTRAFKEYFGMTYLEYTKLHPEYYKKNSNAHTRTVIQYSDSSTTVVYYPSIVSASSTLGIAQSNIGKCLNNKRNHSGGYKWEYAD